MSVVCDTVDAAFAGKRPFRIVVETLVAVGLFKLGAAFVRRVRRKGLRATLTGLALKTMSAVPGGGAAVSGSIASSMRKSMIPAEVLAESINYSLPEAGVPAQELLAKMKGWSSKEKTLWGAGRASGSIYHGGDELLETLTAAYTMFALSNPLHPDLFPWVRKMEAEVVRMTCELFHGGPGSCGAMTSGGTESILMAIKAYRDQALAERGVTAPELIVCRTAHAAFDKAAAYFRIKLVQIDADPLTQQLPPAAVRAALTPNTIAIAASAPTFPHGAVDPVPELAAIAAAASVGLHVDCCLGSFMVPFARELGAQIPAFDFSVPGVTSISADTHKYGFAPKGSSVVMFSSAALRHHMYYVTTSWVGGIYASPTITGSRAGALVAATWAALMHIGRGGYRDAARDMLAVAADVRAGIAKVPGLKVVGDSHLTVIAFGVDETHPDAAKLSVYKVSQAMSKLFHWHLNSLQAPAAAHICVTWANHRTVAEAFLSNLGSAVEAVIARPGDFGGGSAQIYGYADALGGEAPAAAAEDAAQEDGKTGSNSDTGLLADMARAYIDVLTYVPDRA